MSVPLDQNNVAAAG